MALDELEKIPIVGSCLSRLAAWLFGGVFLAAGIYLCFFAAGPHRIAELSLGAVTLLTGLFVIIPWGLGFKRAAKPLGILWAVSLALVLLASLIAASVGGA